MRYTTIDLLGAPTLHDARKERLFRVIRDIRPEPVDHSSEVSVWTTNYFRYGHAGLQLLKHT